MKIDKDIFSKLTDEQKERAKKANSPEALLSIAKEVGYELTPDQMQAVTGGWGYEPCDAYDCDQCDDCDMM